MAVTSVRIQPDLEETLEQMAGRLHRSKSWLINRAVREYIERAEEGAARWQQTLVALESVAKGRVVDGDAVHEWLESWGSAKELPAPKVKR
jgi:predicted transcriptional regulator